MSSLLCAERRITMFGLELSPSANSCVRGLAQEGGGCLSPQSLSGLLQVTWGENLPTSGLKTVISQRGRLKTTFKGCSLHVCCAHVALGAAFMCSSAIELKFRPRHQCVLGISRHCRAVIFGKLLGCWAPLVLGLLKLKFLRWKQSSCPSLAGLREGDVCAQNRHGSLPEARTLCMRISDSHPQPVVSPGSDAVAVVPE